MNLPGRLRARWRLRRGRVRLYWHADYSPCCLRLSERAPAVPLDRVPRAIGQLEAEGFVRPGDLRAPPLASYDELGLVHTPAYMEATTDAERLARVFALDPGGVDVDALLRWQRRAVGGTIAACRAAIHGGARVAVNLGGGFHHAEPDRGSGFCVFNDVAVAIAWLRRRGFPGRVGVVDLDFHDGEGNTAALAADPSIGSFSVHGALWRRDESRPEHELVLAHGTGDAEYLRLVRTELPVFLERLAPALVVYIAGQDVLDGDPLGGFALSVDGVLRRDRLVLDAAAGVGAPAVVLLGGGYSGRAWECVANLLRYALADRRRPGRTDASGVRVRFERIAAGLDPLELQRDPLDPRLTEDDVLGDLGQARPRHRFLDHYTLHGLEYGFERYGLLPHLRQLGFDDLRLEADSSDPWRQMVRVLGARGGGPGQVLVELVARRARLVPPAPWRGPELEFLRIEWLLLQDPTSAFSLARPRLPGQDHPGLGIAVELGEMLRQAALRLGLAGVVARPAHFHNAVGAREFHFLQPSLEGRTEALARVLAPWPIDEASRLLEEGALRLETGEVVAWQPGDHVLATDGHLARYLGSADYRCAVEAAREGLLGAGLYVDAPAPTAR